MDAHNALPGLRGCGWPSQGRSGAHVSDFHVAFALGHLGEHLDSDPSYRHRLRTTIERRHDTLASTAGLASAVHDSLVVLAAGSWEPEAIAAGWASVQSLQAEMRDGRQRRLVRLGFSDHEAAELSALHTRNFM